MNALAAHQLDSTNPIRQIFAEQLRKGQSVRMNIKGRSMHPFIQRDDTVIVKPIRFQEVRTGDIIVYTRSPDQDFTAHRLIRRRKDAQGREFLFTKADANMYGDLPVYPEDLYGKVAIIERRHDRIINLETKLNRLSSCLIAYLSWTSAILKEAIIFPSRFLKRVRKYFSKKVAQGRPLQNNCSGRVHSAKSRQVEDKYLLRAISKGIVPFMRLDKSCNIKDGFDWDYLLDQARRNGVSPLLYFYQKEEENLPKEFFEQLEKDYYKTLTCNILIQEEIAPILKSFQENGIKVILLKGIGLSVTVYPSPGLRSMSDVDILIKDEDIFKVNETLNRFGYFPIDINPQDIELGKLEYLTTLDYRNKNLSLHLHRHLVNSSIPNFSYISKINMKEIWQMARPIEIFGIKALFLSPEHLIIYLCEHSLRVTHSLSRLILIADISQAINYYQDKIDWDFLVKESYNFGLERMVYCGLYSLNKVLRTDVSSNILAILKPKRLSIGEKIFLSLIAKNKSSPGLSYVVHLAMNKKASQKIKFLFRTLFPPGKVLAQRNYIPPSKINYLYDVSRLKEVLRHATTSILR